jgi:hypothetical protein
MGASGWHYFAPFQADISKALRELQEDIFQRGNYLKMDDSLESIDEWIASLRTLPADDHLTTTMLNEAQWRRQLVSRGEPTTIEELREWNAESGTHSIIDILSVGDVATFGVAAPLTDEELVRLFGTTQPTRTMTDVSETIRTLTDLRDNWEGTYVVLYHDGQPDEILFAGFSGD